MQLKLCLLSITIQNFIFISKYTLKTTVIQHCTHVVDVNFFSHLCEEKK